jgi:hypothetical protein
MSREATFFSGDVMQQHWANEEPGKIVTASEAIQLRSVRRWQTSKKTCK